MTEHDAPIDGLAGGPLDPAEVAVDQRLTAAVRTARATTRPPEHHTFLAAARTQRNRRRRRRRVWTVATPIAAAILVVVAVGAIAAGGGNSATTNSASRARTEPDVDATTPIRVSPDRDLTDGQTVLVSAYRGVEVTFSQCAVVRTVEGQRFYACAQDPTDLSSATQGQVPAGSTDDGPVARGTLMVHERLRGHLHLLSYPDGGQTDLTTETGDVSCDAETIATVTPVPTGTGADTTAPTTAAQSAQGTTTVPAPARSQCVVMATGLFWSVRAALLTAPISFAAGDAGPSETAGAESTVVGNLADVRLSASDDTIDVRVRPSGSQTWRDPVDVDTPNESDAWVERPIGLDAVTIHVVVLPQRSRITNAADVAEVAVGTVECGRFECAVYEVPRDRAGPGLELKVESRGHVSTIPLDSVSTGGGTLRFLFDG